MALKTYKPTTPSQRQLVLVDRSALYGGKPVKALTEGQSSTGGRNNNGRITVRFRGGGHKQAYRVIDFKRRKFGVNARVERIEYALEYGVDALECHRDAFGAGHRVLVVDDVLATGGTAAAACALVESLGATVRGCSFLVELSFLGGRRKLDGRRIERIVRY